MGLGVHVHACRIRVQGGCSHSGDFCFCVAGQGRAARRLEACRRLSEAVFLGRGRGRGLWGMQHRHAVLLLSFTGRATDGEGSLGPGQVFLVLLAATWLTKQDFGSLCSYLVAANGQRATGNGYLRPVVVAAAAAASASAIHTDSPRRLPPTAHQCTCTHGCCPRDTRLPCLRGLWMRCDAMR